MKLAVALFFLFTSAVAQSATCTLEYYYAEAGRNYRSYKIVADRGDTKERLFDLGPQTGDVRDLVDALRAVETLKSLGVCTSIKTKGLPEQ